VSRVYVALTRTVARPNAVVMEYRSRSYVTSSVLIPLVARALRKGWVRGGKVATRFVEVLCYHAG
jgi:hypothetical protein